MKMSGVGRPVSGIAVRASLELLLELGDLRPGRCELALELLFALAGKHDRGIGKSRAPEGTAPLLRTFRQ